MTVVTAAITKKDGIVMSCDSELSNSWNKDKDGYSKIWVDEKSRYLIGGCGSLRAMQIMKYWVELPFPHNEDDPEKFAVEEMSPLLRNALSEHGALYSSKKSEYFEGLFLVAWDDTLIVIDSDFGIVIPVSKRYAIGSGMSEALGHLGNVGPGASGGWGPRGKPRQGGACGGAGGG